MTRFLVYLLFFGSVLYLLSWWGRRQLIPPPTDKENAPKINRWFRPKINPRETWLQVYETASLQEAQDLQARLQEEEIECILYEQGKRDIHGNSLKGIGVAVPKTAASQAQRIISRMPA